MKDYKRENPAVGAYSNTPQNESLSYQRQCLWTYPLFAEKWDRILISMMLE